MTTNDASYRKHNDRSHNSSTYHKKDGTPVRAKLDQEAEAEIREVCDGCKQPIDPEVCWCGEYVKDHGYFDNHSAIPMGCDCFRDSA